MIRLGVQSSIASKYSSWKKENNALSGSCLFFFGHGKNVAVLWIASCYSP